MKFSLIKLNRLSGNRASIYAIQVKSEIETSLDKFISENSYSFKSETNDIVQRLISMGHKTGAREHFFKENEGKPGDGVCALYDDPDSHLRLYCIRFGSQLIVIGGGGHKPKTIRALQEDEKLTEENFLLRWLSAQITQRIKDKEIRYTNDHFDFDGDLEFEYEEL
ncbi:MAG TPA: hypothetical protein VFG10_13965 [Saprospiraceae bacterium]|nr:hypothetical protein [Saprospiraceae bacterium]